MSDPIQSHFLLCPVGSAGDVFPFVGLGVALKGRGHRVTILTSGYFEDTVLDAGLEFVDVLPKEDFLKLASNPLLWHPIHGARSVLELLTPDLLRRSYSAISSRYVPGHTVAATSCIGFAPRIVHDKLGMPLATIDLQPLVIWSAYGTPKIKFIPRGPLVPRWLKNLLYRCAERFVLDPMVCPTLNDFRRELDLPPVQQVTHWWHSPQRILGLFPPWYASAQPDWPEQVRLTQFPLWNANNDEPLPDDVMDFLDAGDPPIIFTPGSANRFGKPFFAAAAGACQKIGKRGMFFSQFDEHIPPSLPNGVRHFRYAPFRQLLPHAAAIAHHGGIGTSAQAMEAGIPQLIMPLSHDQPDNAERLARLGVGDYLYPKRFHANAVAEKLQRLLDQASVAKACHEVAQRFVDVDPYQQACEIMEALIGTD